MSSANNPVPSSSREYSGPFKGSGFLCNVSVKSWPNLSSSLLFQRLRIGKREDASVNIIQQREKEKDKSNDDDKNALDRKTDGQR